MRCLWGGLVLVLAVSGGTLRAAEPAAVPAAVDFLAESTEPATPSFPIVRLVLSLAAVMGLLYAARPLLKRGFTAVHGSGQGIDIVGRAILGPKAGLCVARVGGRRFLLGLGGEGVRLLADLGEDRASTTPPTRPDPESEA